MEVKLAFIRKDRAIQFFRLPSAVTFIGRRQDCDLCIPLPVVSRRHCEIYSEFGELTVRDLKSQNGTFVNNEPIEEVSLKAGDAIRIGPITLIVQIDGAPDHFDKFFPQVTEQPIEHQATPASKKETQETDLDDALKGLSVDNASQSQTMDLDNIFTNDFLGDDGIDLNSELPE